MSWIRRCYERQCIGRRVNKSLSRDFRANLQGWAHAIPGHPILDSRGIQVSAAMRIHIVHLENPICLVHADRIKLTSVHPRWNVRWFPGDIDVQRLCQPTNSLCFGSTPARSTPGNQRLKILLHMCTLALESAQPGIRAGILAPFTD